MRKLNGAAHGLILNFFLLSQSTGSPAQEKHCEHCGLCVKYSLIAVNPPALSYFLFLIFPFYTSYDL
jgi:hypothetical protein